MNADRYPVWASLARDYLAVMPTSVSSERAFSQGGITISDRRTRLKADVVEALQFLKCSLRQDLLLQGTQPAAELEAELELEEDESTGDDSPGSTGTGSTSDAVSGRQQRSWDLILDDSDDDLYDDDRVQVDDLYSSSDGTDNVD